MSPLKLVKSDAAAESDAGDRSAGVPSAVREPVRRLFEFLKRFEERRSPIRRDVDEVDWRLYLSELPRHPAIKTGAGRAGAEGTEPGLVLSVERPACTIMAKDGKLVQFGVMLDASGRFAKACRPSQTASENEHSAEPCRDRGRQARPLLTGPLGRAVPVN